MLFERTEDWDERVAVGELGSSRNAVVEQQQHEQLERLELLPKLLVSKILKRKRKNKFLSQMSHSHNVQKCRITHSVEITEILSHIFLAKIS